jgi:hypothetical protein
MTVNYGKSITKARIDWCDETLVRLNRMMRANQPKKN